MSPVTMQAQENTEEQRALIMVSPNQEAQIAAQHLEHDRHSVTSETSHASSAHDSVDNSRVSPALHQPMPQPLPITLTLAQPPEVGEREYATLTPLSSAGNIPHIITPVSLYASYVNHPSVTVTATTVEPVTATGQQPIVHTIPVQSSQPQQSTPIVLTTAGVPRKPAPIPAQVQKAGKSGGQVLSTEELTRDQLVLLEKAYRDSPYPSYHQLASELKIEVFKVKAWFRKRRRNLHTEIGIEMSKEDEQKVFKQFITQHHDQWRGGQPPPGLPPPGAHQSSHINPVYLPLHQTQVIAEPQEGEAKETKMDQSETTVTAVPTVVPSQATEQDQQSNQAHPPAAPKSKALPKSSKSKSSTSTIRSLLKKEVKYEPLQSAPVAVTSPQPPQHPPPPQAAEQPPTSMTYIPSVYQSPEIENLMREREYLGRLLHQQQMEWQETRKKLVDCDRRLAKATSTMQATTYTTTSHQNVTPSESVEPKWHVPQTYHQAAAPGTTTQYVIQADRPPSHGSTGEVTVEGQVQAVTVVTVPQGEGAEKQEGEQEAPQLTQLYAAAPIVVHPGENHYMWQHPDQHPQEHHQQHPEPTQYTYVQQPLDGNNNKDQPLQPGSVENSQGQPSPYYSDYSGSPASSHDATENHGNTKGKRRNRTTYTREQIRQLEAFFEANPHPESGDREQIAQSLGLSGQNVRIWFKNRRAKSMKRDDQTPTKR